MGEPNSPMVNRDLQDKEFQKFCQLFTLTAGLQGRFAYLLMSFHAVNPAIAESICQTCNPTPYLWANMLYGIALMLYSRPSMVAISRFNRVVFSVLGSLMFNHASMLVYPWLVEKYPDRPYLLTFFGFLGGRIMMLHLLAFLYHMDSRSRFLMGSRTQSEYESMYR